MRYVYIALIVVFTVAVAMFKFQNLQAATLLLGPMNVTLPMSVLVLLIYVLGMFSGGFLVSLVRGWIRGARASN